MKARSKYLHARPPPPNKLHQGSCVAATRTSQCCNDHMVINIMCAMTHHLIVQQHPSQGALQLTIRFNNSWPIKACPYNRVPGWPAIIVLHVQLSVVHPRLQALRTMQHAQVHTATGTCRQCGAAACNRLSSQAHTSRPNHHTPSTCF